jgi:hypothetical protein
MASPTTRSHLIGHGHSTPVDTIMQLEASSLDPSLCKVGPQTGSFGQLWPNTVLSSGHSHVSPGMPAGNAGMSAQQSVLPAEAIGATGMSAVAYAAWQPGSMCVAGNSSAFMTTGSVLLDAAVTSTKVHLTASTPHCSDRHSDQMAMPNTLESGITLPLPTNRNQCVQMDVPQKAPPRDMPPEKCLHTSSALSNVVRIASVEKGTGRGFDIGNATHHSDAVMSRPAGMGNSCSTYGTC